MPWWGWLILGFGLLGAELFVIDAEFYLVFLGTAAVVVGLVGLAGLTLPDWAQWLIFAALAILSMLTFRRRVYQRLRGRIGHVPERVSRGDRVLVPTRLEPGQSCRVDYRGTSWTARNVGPQPIAQGSEAVISNVDELTLHVTSGATPA
jgi:inner membrane protein